MNRLNFSIHAVSALSPHLRSVAEWQQWADTPLAVKPEAEPFRSALIPMMQARRLSPLNSMAMHIALSLSSEYDVKSALFCSRHGQLSRSHHLFSQVAAKAALSPTDFAMSVHNAVAGLFSIVAKKNIPINAVSAQEGSLLVGLVEAAASLSDEHNQVLVVCSDDDVPDFYRPYLADSISLMPMALGLVLGKGNDWRLEMRVPSVEEMNEIEAATFSMQQWAACYFQERQDFCLKHGEQLWRFIKN